MVSVKRTARITGSVLTFKKKKKREKNITILSKQTVPSLNAVQGTALKRAALAHQAEVQQVSNYTLNMFWM